MHSEVNVLNATELYTSKGFIGKFHIRCILPGFKTKSSS